MALPCVLATALVLASSGNADLSISASSSEAEIGRQEVEVECTSITLEYLSGGKLKKARSDNCPEHKNLNGGKDKFQDNILLDSETDK